MTGLTTVGLLNGAASVASATTTAGVTVACGNGNGSAANQCLPAGVFVDAAHNVYVADAQNNRVQKWAPGAAAGVTVAGGNGQGSAANQLDDPSALFVDGAGNIYIADTGNNRVQKWAPGASAGVTVAGGNGEGSAANQLWLPQGVFVHAGDVYVADSVNGRVQRWAPSATAGVTVADPGAGTFGKGLVSPVAVFVNGAGDLYATVDADYSSQVQEWAPGARSGNTIAGGTGAAGSAAGQLDDAGGLFVDGAGDLYVADFGNERVQEWKPGPKGAPLDTLDPQSQTILEGANVTFSAGALAHPYPAAQWQRSTDGGTTWTDISAATSPAHTITATPYADNGEEFRAVFTNGAGSVTTAPATLTVDPVPTTTMLVPPDCDASGPCVTLSGITAFDASASSRPVSVTQVQFEVGESAGDVVVSTATLTPYGWIGSWNTTTVPNAEYTVYSVATNSVGVSARSPEVLIKVDNPPPKTKVVLPKAGATESGATALLKATASANVTSVEFTLTGGSYNGTVISTATQTPSGWNGSWNTTVVPNGIYTLRSVASYSGGVKGTSAPVTMTVAN